MISQKGPPISKAAAGVERNLDGESLEIHRARPFSNRIAVLFLNVSRRRKTR
jgi:hypothetical protein